jgi:uncharacterized protein YndB with AHSA1/START domain
MERKIMGCRLAAACLAGVALIGSAQAEVKAAAPDGFVIQLKGQAPLAREAAWSRLVDIASWWSGAHTYSGHAKALSVDAVAGGCWCESWADGEVEHGRVVQVLRGSVLRFDTALGPLQGLGVVGVLTFTLTDGATPDTTAVVLDYRVSGSAQSGLDQMAAPVDQVLSEQFKRLTTPD